MMSKISGWAVPVFLTTLVVGYIALICAAVLLR